VAVAAAIDLHDPLAVQSDFSVLPDPLSVLNYQKTVTESNGAHYE
jgi:hypothetical protein